MARATFPTWAECLEEFGAGMRESRKLCRDAENCALPVSPLLRKATVSYADFMAGREPRNAN